MKKRKIVLNDKAKISAVIAELDQKKNEALKKAWEQVNKVMFIVVNIFWLVIKAVSSEKSLENFGFNQRYKSCFIYAK